MSSVALNEGKLQAYMESLFGKPVWLRAVSVLGEPRSSEALKGYGYGVPLRLEYEISGQNHRAVLETISPGPFDHEHMADRARILLWSHHAFNQLPQHARSLDIGGFGEEGDLLSVGKVREFFLLNEYLEGKEYFHDLERLSKTPGLPALDLARADALCDYLVTMEVAAPFFAFRALVMASPVWYPTLNEAVREKLFAFIRATLDSDIFDPGRVNDCFGNRA